jgi:hypothetical protein
MHAGSRYSWPACAKTSLNSSFVVESVRTSVHDGAITNWVVIAPRFQALIWAASVRIGGGGFEVAGADDIAMVIILLSASNETVRR